VPPVKGGVPSFSALLDGVGSGSEEQEPAAVLPDAAPMSSRARTAGVLALRAVAALACVVLAHFAALLAAHVATLGVDHLNRRVNSSSDADAMQRTVAMSLVGRAAYWVTLAGLLLLLLALVGVRTVAATAVLGSVLFAVGLGLQGTLSDLAAGIMLLAANTFRIGDFIEIKEADVAGNVADFSVLYTRLVDEDSGIDVLVPNRLLYGSVLVNHSSASKHGVVLELTVSNLNSNEVIASAMDGVVKAAGSHEAVLTSPPVRCRVSRVDGVGTTLELRYALTPENYQVQDTTRNVQAEVATLVREAVVKSGVVLVVWDRPLGFTAASKEKGFAGSLV
jgi:small conductance mechanosensitive channel